MQSQLYVQILKTLKMDLWDDETLALLKMLKWFREKKIFFFVFAVGFSEKMHWANLIYRHLINQMMHPDLEEIAE